MMSRRKQQNPKPLKYNEPSVGPSQISDSTDEQISNETPKSPSPNKEPIAELQTEGQPIIKEEPESPQTAVEPASPARVEVDDKVLLPTTLPSPNLESLLGVPDSAPLKVQRNTSGGYKILSAKYIAQGAGLDPLKARRIDAAEEKALLEGKLQVVSFASQHLPGERVYFHLESSINCGWLRCLGEPSPECAANVHIYYAGDQLWVEVVHDLNEGTQLIAEFKEPNRQPQPSSPQEHGPQPMSSAPSRPQPSTDRASVEAQFPCSLCGVQFRNPNTLMAHRKHYCSKLASPSSTTTAVSADQDSVGAGEMKELTDNLQQSAYICLMCKFMTLTESDMKSHVKEKHKVKQEAEAAVGGSGSDNTYCEDCEIHFKKPESYQAHKLHYCKNRTSSTSPRSDSGGNQTLSQSSSPLSPVAKEACYKKVSVFDNQTLSASLATQAALAAASLPFTLSSMLNLPAAMGALPMMPHLKMFQSPALFAQAMQSAVQATSVGIAPSTSAAGSSQREETPLDLTIKSDTSSLDGLSAPTKRKMSSEREEVASKIQSLSSPASPATIPLLSPRVNGHVKPLKPERPIYRCESCSIPFYKKDVYEAHKLHYCSRRSSSGSEKEEETPAPSRPAKPERQSPLKTADDRLVITYTCNKCSTSYRTIETFNAHQCTVVAQPPPPLLRCDECNFTSQSNRALAEHVEGHQKVNVMYKCKLCGYHGNTLRGMRQHGRQHMLKGEEFNDNDVEAMELQPTKPQLHVKAGHAPYCHDVDEELLRLKNEPYKKRRSRKHYQKSEYIATAVSPQPKENGLTRSRSSSPHSTSTVSCTSPLQLSTTNVLHNDRVLSSPPANVKVKREPTEHVSVDPKAPFHHAVERHSNVADKQANPIKRYVCSCNTAFASVSTFEAHKKLYCSHHKSQRSNPTIAVNH